MGLLEDNGNFWEGWLGQAFLFICIILLVGFVAECFSSMDGVSRAPRLGDF